MEDILSDVYEKPKLASIGARIGAAFIDFVIIVVIFYGFVLLWGEPNTTPGESGVQVTGAPAFLFFGICFLLIPIQEGVSGKTLGKRVMGIRVKRNDLQESGIGPSIVRHLFDLIDCMCLVGIIVAASTQRRQRIGDIVAGTVVVPDK